MSDRIAVMRRGRIEQLGTPVEIYERPGSAFVADFIGNTNLLRGVVAGQDGAVTLVDCGGTTLRAVAADGRAAPGQEAVIALRPEKIVLGAPKAMDNQLSATVTHLVYLGESVVYHLRSEGGIELEALELARAGAVSYPVGTPVEVGWRAEHACLLAS